MLHTEFDSPQEAAHAGDSRRPLNHKSPISLVRSVVLNWHTKARTRLRECQPD